MLPVPTLADLALFSGRPETSYSPFADQALMQATLMFSVVTELPDWPADPDLKQIAINAILEMADRLILEQPFQGVKASPFQSESIGSYSYSRNFSMAKVTSAAADKVGIGLFWWDTAVDLLAQKDVLLTASGSIAVHSEGLQPGRDGLQVESPVDYNGPDRPPYIRIS